MPFLLSSVVGTKKKHATAGRTKARISLNCCGSHFFAAASVGCNDPAAVDLAHLRFLLSHRMVEQHWHIHHKAAASGSSLLAALPCGKIQSSRPRRKWSMLSQLFFCGILVIMDSAVSTATVMHNDQQLQLHCFFQPSGTGASALSCAAITICAQHHCQKPRKFT